MKKIILIVCIFSFCTGIAQTAFGEVVSDLKINTPAVASLESYAVRPVSLAKGEINVSIPLFKLKGSDLVLPIELSYRQGVKIHNASEYTGHGWSLFAGGLITRTVIGEVDPYVRYDFDGNTGTSEEDFLAILNHHKDAAPDTFSYNFNGYTGQFVLRNDLTTPYYIKTQRDWQIAIANESITIVTADGTQYVFEDTIQNSIEREGGDYYDDNVTTSWYLTEIRSAKKNEKIRFSYYEENTLFERVRNNRLIIDPSNQTTGMEYNNLPEINNNEKRIDEISLISENQLLQKLTFDSSTLREDLSIPSYALSKISLFSKDETLPINYFKFTIENVNGERIFLKSIQEFSGDGSLEKPPYQFEYISPELLPARLEYKADMWGYYSSAHGGEFPYDPDYSWISNPTKAASLSATYGSLKKVVFPLGGYQEFEYGLNEYQIEGVTKLGGGIRIEQQKIGDTQTSTERVINYTYQKSDANSLITEESSGQITEEPIKTLYTPTFQNVNGFGEFVDKYSMKSVAKHVENSWVNYTEVREEEAGKGFTIHRFNGLFIDGQGAAVDRYVNNFESFVEPFESGAESGFIPGAQSDMLYTDRWPFDGMFITNALLNKPASISSFKYNSAGEPVLIKKDSFAYYRFTQDRLIKGQAVCSNCSIGGQSIYVMNYTEYDREYSLLKSKETTTYGEDSSPLSEKTVYTYHPLNYHFFPTKITTSKSNGDAITKRIKYAQEYGNFDFAHDSSINISDLKTHNMHVPVEEQIWRKSTMNSNSAELKAAKLYIYDKISATQDFFKPTKILTYENFDIYNSSYFSTEFNRAWHPKIDWYNDHFEIDYVPSLDLAYYDSGNLKQINKTAGTKTFYVWGYHQSQPIAKITGFTSIDEAQQTAINNAIAASLNETTADTEAHLRTKLQLLKDSFASTNAQVTTFTYDPLIGITSMTDPRGRTVYYHYDAFNRLEYVKDAEDNILNKNEYNYKN